MELTKAELTLAIQELCEAAGEVEPAAAKVRIRGMRTAIEAIVDREDLPWPEYEVRYGKLTWPEVYQWLRRVIGREQTAS